VKRDDAQRLVYHLCADRRFDKLSDFLLEAYHRGLEGMAAAHPKSSLQFAAWKAGREAYKFMEGARRRDPTRQDMTIRPTLHRRAK